MRSSRLIHALLILAGAATLAACQAPPAAKLATRAARPAVPVREPQLLPVPTGAVSALVDIAGGASLTGTSAFSVVTDPHFQSSSAWRLLAMPAGHAMVTLASLEEAVYAHQGKPLVTGSDATGRFTFSGNAPADRPFVVHANLVQNHRLSALALPGMSDLTVDEASTMVTEMARWQLREQPLAIGHDAEEKTLSELTSASLAALVADSRAFATADAFASRAGSLPFIASLQAGAGHVLRNAYVAAFGAASGAAADAVSDAWTTLLGFRPLALTVEAGNGNRGYDQGDGKAPTTVPFTGLADAVSDHLGNLYLTEMEGHRLRFVPKSAMAGPYLARTGALEAGAIYTIGGTVNTITLASYNAGMHTREGPQVTTPSAAFALAPGIPLYTPYKLVVEQVGTTDASHLYFTSIAGHRVLFVPGASESRYGRNFEAGRIYTLVGNGATGAEWFGTTEVEADDAGTTYNEQRFAYKHGEGGPGHLAQLSNPTGLAQDSRHNLYVLDSVVRAGKDLKVDDPAATYAEPHEDPSAPAGRRMQYYHGTVRVLRAADGTIFTLRLTLGGEPFSLDGANDVRVVESASGNWLYVAHTKRHVVIRAALPADLSVLDTTVPAPAEVEVVLGQLDKPGFIDTDLVGVTYPEVYDLGDGVPQAHALLNGPKSLDFDDAGRLVVADAARIRLLNDDAQVYTLAGGLDTRYLSGDARLAFLPGTTFLNFDGPSRTFWVTDGRENVARRLWTQRGSL